MKKMFLKLYSEKDHSGSTALSSDADDASLQKGCPTVSNGGEDRGREDAVADSLVMFLDDGFRRKQEIT